MTDDKQPWREAVQEAAQQAAVREAETMWIGPQPVFNYRLEHVEAVVRTALRLAKLTGADLEIVEAAACLHDVAKVGSEHHGIDGAIEARRILVQTDFPAEKIPAVADAIARHVGLWVDEGVRIEPLEAAVLWDADKLVKLGAQAVLHFLGDGGARRGPATTRALIDRLPGSGWQDSTVRSFQTEAARRVGAERWRFFQEFCARAACEFDALDL